MSESIVMEGEDDDCVPVAVAAARLGTTEPRLRRLLRLPEWEHAKREREYETRTGTRTGLVVPVSVLPGLADSLVTKREREHERNAQKRERERKHCANKRERVSVPVPASDGVAAATATDAWVDIRSEELIAELRARVADLQAALERERLATDAERAAASDLRRLLDQQQRLMGALQQAQPLVGAGEIEGAAQAVPEAEAKKRPWWRPW